MTPLARDPIKCLPPDISILIFRKFTIFELARCMLVCRRWYYVLDKWAVLWKYVVIHEPHTINTNAGIDQYRYKNGRYQEGSGMFSARLISNGNLNVLARRAGSALSELSIGFAPLVTNDGLRSLILYDCSHIRHLEIRSNSRISNAAFGELFAHIGASLEYIALSTTDISDYAVQNIWLHSPNLKYLDLSNCRFITCDAFPLVNLRHIEFCHKSRTTTSDTGCGCRERKSVTIPKLEALLLASCTSVGDRTVHRISSAFGRNLKELDLSYTRATVQSLGMLAATCATADRRSSHTGYQSVARSADRGSRSLKLERARFTGFNFSMHMDNLTNNTTRNETLERQSMALFAESSCNLRSIAIGGENDAITDEFVALLARSCPDLEEIDLHDSMRIGDAGLIALGEHCKGLKDVNISGCIGCTTVGVIGLVDGCRDIWSLDLSGLRIGDEALIRIGDNMRRLEILALDLCSRITDAGIKAVVEGSDGFGCLFTLRELSFVQCRYVDDDSIVPWCKERLHPEAVIECRFSET